MLPLPYAQMAGALLVVALFVGTYIKGRVDGREVCHSRIEVLQAEASKAAVNEQNQAIKASTDLENQRVQTQIKYRTITRTVEKVVDRPIYRNVCLDDDGVRYANTALTGQVAAPGEPHGEVPTPADAH